MIRYCIINGICNDALIIYYQMQRTRVFPNVLMFTLILKICANLGFLFHSKKVLDCIVKNGFEFEDYLGSTLIDMYPKCGEFKGGRQVFEKMC